MSDWPNVRLHVVTGKGGTGKSTVAAALALFASVALLFWYVLRIFMAFSSRD